MKTHQPGFTLVELSIVLVILGLLVGGVLTGQSLIHAAELRSVSTDFARYQTAVGTFRDKYFGIPGDITNATAYWGKDNANCSGNTGTAATPGACNGNGNGLLENAAAGSAPGETFQFWKQLALAGMIEGTYSGLAWSTDGRAAMIGSNVPRSRLSGVGFSIEYLGPTLDSNTILWGGPNGNTMYVGGLYGGAPTTVQTEAPMFKPEDAYNIDKKLDDGLPARGIMRPFRKAYFPDCTTTNDPATSQYDFSKTGQVCNILIPIGY